MHAAIKPKYVIISNQISEVDDCFKNLLSFPIMPSNVPEADAYARGPFGNEEELVDFMSYINEHVRDNEFSLYKIFANEKMEIQVTQIL